MLYPIGIQDFESLRKNGFVYVDKTALIYKLASTGRYYFLGRPRRFGKSLLLSTMEAYFRGKKELFEGLAIAELEQKWQTHPVLRLDLGGKAYDKEDVLDKVLDDILSRWEAEYGVENRSDVAGLRFGNVIEAACRQTGHPVVILIDEYDKPIVDNLGDEALADVFRRQLQGFYSAMKSQDAFIRFGFLTGVTNIGKLSVFSGLNNLKDISMDVRYTDICGISEEDLKSCFDESVGELAEANGLSVKETYSQLAEMYDGYHFHQNSAGIYNPFSVLNTFDSGEFKEYWFETGTPSFLVRYFQRGNYLLDDLTTNAVPASKLSGANYEQPDAVTLLYQSGYLTIKGYDDRFRLYSLDYPNEEVKTGFLQSLSRFYLPAMETRGDLSVYRFIMDIENGDVNALMNRLTALFASREYLLEGDREIIFENTLSTLFQLLGMQVQTERHTSGGRADIILESSRFVYVLELKRDQSADAALAQLEKNGYYLPFLAGGKKIFKIGVNFSSDTQCIDSWKVGD